MITIDGEYKRIPRRSKRKKQSGLGSGASGEWDDSQSAAQNSIFYNTSPGSLIFDIFNQDEYRADSPDAPTQDQINAAQNRSAILDSISATLDSVGSYGKLIMIGIVVFFIATR